MNFDLSNLGRSLTPPADDLCFPPVDPKDDGWTAWPGGECPIPHAKAGEYEVRCSSVTEEHAADWTNHISAVYLSGWDLPGYFVAYRLKPATAATVDGWDLGRFPAEPIPSAEDRNTAQEYAAALNGDDDPVQDTDRPGIANAAMHKAMTTPKPAKPEPRDEPGLLTVAPMGSHARGWGI